MELQVPYQLKCERYPTLMCVYIYIYSIYALLWFSKNVDTAMFSFTKHPHLVTVANIDKH